MLFSVVLVESGIIARSFVHHYKPSHFTLLPVIDRRARASRITVYRRSSLLGRASRQRQRIVIEDRRQPFFGLLERQAFTSGIIFDLVALDLADAEIIALRVAEIEAADRGAGPHGKAFGQPHADRALAVEQLEQSRFLGVVGLRRIAGRRADAAIFFGDQFVACERLVGGVGPKFLAHALVHPLGGSFGEAVGQRLGHDRGIIVVGVLEALGDGFLADAGGHREGADIIGKAAGAWRDEIGERYIGAAFAARELLAQRMQRGDRPAARFIIENENIVA